MLQRRSRSPLIAPPSATDDEQAAFPLVEGDETAVRHYRMVQDLATLEDDFFIQDDQGTRLYKVDGSALQERDSLVFRDMEGNELCRIPQRILHVRDTLEVVDPNGEKVACVRKSMITPLRDLFTVRIGNTPELSVQGNILDHEFRIVDERRTVAVVSKKWFRARDSYGVQIASAKHDIEILAATVCIDLLVKAAR